MRYKIVLFINFIFISFLTYSQVSYTDIPRTRVSIAVPEGYRLMNSYPGFYKNKYEGIFITDLIIGNYYSNAKNFNKENFELKGGKVYEFEDTTICNYPAKFMIVGTDDKRINALSAVFGDSTFSTMINCLYTAEDIVEEEKLKKMIFSIKYNKNKIVDPFEEVSFVVDTTSTIFKLQGFSGNMYAFSPNGEDYLEDKTVVMITPLPYDSAYTLNTIYLMAINSLEKYGMYGFLTDSTSRYTIDHTNALLKIGNCFNELDQIYVYILMLAKNDFFLMIYGMCKYEDEKMKLEISKFCDKIKLIN